MVLKNTANFCENHCKITTKTRHQITGPKTFIQYKTQQRSSTDEWRPSLHAVQGFHM